MEAATAAGRAGLARAREQISGWGLGAWLLGILLFAGVFAAFNNGATAIPQETRLQVGLAATGLACGLGVAAGLGLESLAALSTALTLGVLLLEAPLRHRLGRGRHRADKGGPAQR